MFRRGAGYDADNQDWFWAIYRPDGEVVVNPMGMTMAGMIVGGGAITDAPFNSIACHKAAPDGGYVFLHDAIAKR